MKKTEKKTESKKESGKESRNELRVERSFFQIQKGLYEAALEARRWIGGVFEEFKIEGWYHPLETSMERLEWSLGGISLQKFFRNEQIFPGGMKSVDPGGFNRPFWLLDDCENPSNQVWAWEAFRMTTHSDCRLSADLPLIILLAMEDAANRPLPRFSVRNFDYPPTAEILDRVLAATPRAGEFDGYHDGRDGYRIEDALKRHNLLCEIHANLHACVVDGFGVGPQSYSLFDAACLAEYQLDVHQVVHDLADNEELSLLIRNLALHLKLIEGPIGKEREGRGLKILKQVQERERAERKKAEAKIARAESEPGLKWSGAPVRKATGTTCPAGRSRRLARSMRTAESPRCSGSAGELRRRPRRRRLRSTAMLLDAKTPVCRGHGPGRRFHGAPPHPEFPT